MKTNERSWTPEEVVREYLVWFDWARARGEPPEPSWEAWRVWRDSEDPEFAWEAFLIFLRVRGEDPEALERAWLIGRWLVEEDAATYLPRVQAAVAAEPWLRRVIPPEDLDPTTYTPKSPFSEEVKRAFELLCIHGPGAHEIEHLIRDDPAAALPLVLQIANRAPLRGVGSRDASDPLEELLSVHGPEVIEAVERAAAGSVPVRRCLWRIVQEPAGHVYRLPADIFERAIAAAGGTTDYNTPDEPGPIETLAPENEERVESWFEYEKAFWAWDVINDLLHTSPETAWELLVRAHLEPWHEDAMEMLAVGLLEDLIRAHGPQFIDRIEVLARENAHFRESLKQVWLVPSAPSANIVERLNRVLDTPLIVLPHGGENDEPGPASE